MDWTCPFCGRDVTLTTASWKQNKGYLVTDTVGVDGGLNYEILYVVCPSKNCRQYAIKIDFFKRVRPSEMGGSLYAWPNGDNVLSFRLRPRDSAQPMPEYIPKFIRDDYREACLILRDSPKASAALSRRCIQGIIRDFFDITKGTLHGEIQALQEKLPRDLWEAVDSMRKVGNIGAHCEKDVNVIVDVSSEAAHTLTKLIELLLKETYVREHDRKELIVKVNEAATDVKNQQAPIDESTGTD